MDGVKNVRVVAAIIERDGKLFAAQRGYGDQKGLWEFPGGKMEEGEKGEEALARELREELDMEVSVLKLLHVLEYDYPTFHLSMACYHCKLKKTDFTLKEHLACRWLGPDELASVQWLGADALLIPMLRERFS